MKFLSSINTRLWFTYILLVAFILVASLSGIVVAFRNSPLLYWEEFTRLNYVTDSLVNRLDYYVDSRWNSMINIFLSEAEALDVRVVIMHRDGDVIVDSSGSSTARLPVSIDPNSIIANNNGKILVVRDDNRQYWFYKVRQINGTYYIISAVRRPNFQIQAIFEDELLKPLFRVGLIAMVIAFLISWFVARWITRPLKKISESALQLASGDFPSIVLEGPGEVQQLAGVINRMDMKVRNSIQSQKDFVANVSHEFKTPLTSIRGFAQVLLDGAAKTKVEKQHAAQIIIDETSRLEYLVNDLLMLAKLEAGTIILEQSPVFVDQIITNVLERLKFQVQEKSLKVSKIVDIPVSIFADGERIAQVFTNLLENAIKFNKNGGSIDIHIEECGDFGVISIRDSGIGIPKEDIHNIFGRFYQVDKSRKGGNRKGVGLGLSIAAQIILTHGGEISVTSEVDEGSCFVVKLPLDHGKSN